MNHKKNFKIGLVFGETKVVFEEKKLTQSWFVGQDTTDREGRRKNWKRLRGKN